MDSASPRKANKILPANAYTKLAAGDEYQPIVPAADGRAEVSLWSVTTGLVMVIIFAATCVYISLKAGTGIEAAIPIAVMAIFLGRQGLKPSGKSTILENVMVQSIGQAAGVVAAAAAFLIPALYINELPVQWWQIFLSCAIGGILGVVLIIPLRKYFVKDLHGELPFPEATAINEIIVSGESTSASSGKVLLLSFGLGAIYDFVAEAVRAWNPTVTTKTLLGSVGEKMSSLRMDISMSCTAALFGIGYIVGLRYSAIIAGGSIFAWLVLTPMVYIFGSAVPEFTYAGKHCVIANMTSFEIFKDFVRPIGIGAIAVSAVFSIIRMGRIVLASVALGFKGLKGGSVDAAPRTQKDIAPRNVLLIQIGATLLMALLFFVIGMTNPDASTGKTFSAADSLWFAVVGAAVGFALSFLFTPVAAQGIAMVGSNPISGMTLIAVVITILAMKVSGLSGNGGMFISLIVGCAVCTALSMSGGLISDFKVGYWAGSTPRNQEVWKFVGVLLAALVVAFVIPVMDSAYHFLVVDPATGLKVSNSAVLPAPQANIFAAVSNGLLKNPANQPWMLYGLGGIMAVVLYMIGTPMLPFALGIFLPIDINMAVLAGALVSHLVSNSGGSERIRQARNGQGILIASGMMAGAAIVGGIVPAVMRLPKIGAPIQYISIGEKFWLQPAEATDDLLVQHKTAEWFDGFTGQGLGLLTFIALGVLCFWLAKKGAEWSMREEEEAERAEST